MTCEMCGEEFDHLYNADMIADVFGEVPCYDDDNYLVCCDCLNKIGDAVRMAWRDRRCKGDGDGK